MTRNGHYISYLVKSISSLVDCLEIEDEGKIIISPVKLIMEPTIEFKILIFYTFDYVKMKRAAVFVVQLLVVCSAFPSRPHHMNKEIDDFVKKTMDSAFDPLADFFSLPEIRLPKLPFRLTVTKHFPVNYFFLSKLRCKIVH